jgi:ATP-dependent DNA ligase
LGARAAAERRPANGGPALPWVVGASLARDPAYHRPRPMADQLALPLDATADRLPALPDLRPMLPRPLPEAFDSPDHLFEPWWGGTRALVFVGPAAEPGGGDVRIVDAEGVDRSASLPELAGTAVRVAARSAILDGELVVVDAEGRADAAALAARLDGGAGRPVAFLAFDLLHLDGTGLLNQPLTRRREALRRILRPGDEVVAVPAIATEGRALFDAIAAQGLAGMMARQRQGPYLPGTRSRLWRLIPARLGAVSLAELAGAPAEPAASASATGPVLAMLNKLPLDLDEIG